MTSRAYYLKHKEKIKERVRERRLRKIDEIRKKASEYGKRTKWKTSVNKRYRQMVLNLLLQRDGNICAICNTLMPDILDMQIDHKIPRVLGGDNSATNLQVAHKKCNLTKDKATFLIRP